MSAVYEEKALTVKALLKYLDGTADGKKVAVSGEAVVSEEAGETEDTHPKPEPDAPQGHPARTDMSFFFREPNGYRGKAAQSLRPVTKVIHILGAPPTVSVRA